MHFEAGAHIKHLRERLEVVSCCGSFKAEKFVRRSGSFNAMQQQRECLQCGFGVGRTMRAPNHGPLILHFSKNESASEFKRTCIVSDDLMLNDAKVKTVIIDRTRISIQPSAVAQVKQWNVAREDCAHRLG